MQIVFSFIWERVVHANLPSRAFMRGTEGSLWPWRPSPQSTKIFVFQQLHGRKLRRVLAFAFKKSWPSRTSKSSYNYWSVYPKLGQFVSFLLYGHLTIHTVSHCMNNYFCVHCCTQILLFIMSVLGRMHPALYFAIYQLP